MLRFAPRDFLTTDAESLAQALIGQTLLRVLSVQPIPLLSFLRDLRVLRVQLPCSPSAKL